MANLKLISKTSEFGIIRQNPAIEGGSGQSTSNAAFMAQGLLDKSWNDPGIGTTNYRRILYNDGSVVFDPGVTTDQYISTGQNGIHDEDGQFFIGSRDGLPTMAFAMPGDQKTIVPHFVGALLGAVTEDATTPYSKSIACGGLTGAIDFTNNAAELVTLSMTDKASADDGIILEDAIINELTLAWDFNAAGIARLMQMSGTWIGSELNYEQTMTGTTVTTALTPYNNAETYSFTTLTVNSVDISAEAFRSYTFSVNNNVRANNKGASGKPGNYDVKPEYTSIILLDYNSVTEKFLSDFQEGQLVVATIASSTTPTLDGGLSIACVKGRLMSQPFDYNEEFDAVQLDVKWFADGANTPLTVVVTDTQDWTY